MSHFHTARRHTKTCSPKCRLIYFKLKKGLEWISNHYGHMPIKMGEQKAREIADFIKKAILKDCFGNQMFLDQAYTDEQGNIVRIIFRSHDKKFLETWNSMGNGEIKATIFRYG